MGRVFNTTGVCIPEKHYMVNINGRLQQIKVLVDEGKYFTIKELISVDTLKTMQLLGFNYKAAIGEPLTHLCANAIAGWGNKSNAQKRR